MTANFGKNQGVANTLDTYLQQDKPRFAILLQGKWGSGKTWFIREYIKYNGNDAQQFCYMSLFGIEQLKEIDSKIIACCSSHLSKAVGLSRLAGAIIERCYPVIKEGDIEKIGEFLKKLCKIPDNLVLVLDDLERSSIPLELVVGYVSNMLDELGIKVILLCDPEQFSKDEETFLRFKEKIIGTSIAISPDIETVFDFQIKYIKNPQIKNIFHENKDILVNDYLHSKSNNLRNIKRIIYEFLMCYEAMSDEMKNNKFFLAKFLHILFVFSIEINKGRPKDEFLKKMIKIYVYYEYPHLYSDIDEAPGGSQWYAPISRNFIEKFFYDGVVDKDLMYKSYATSAYANPSELPLIIYHKFSQSTLDDQEAKQLYKELATDINNRKYTDPKIILYGFDIMLKFSQIGLEHRSMGDIVQLANDYLSDAQISDEQFEISIPELNSSFLSRDFTEFKIIYEAICKRVEKIRKDKIDILIRGLPQLLPGNPEKVIADFPCEDGYQVSLISADPEDFAKKIIQIPNPQLNNILKKIYHNIKFVHAKPSEDIHWIIKFYSSIKEKLPSISPIRRNTLEIFLRMIERNYPREFQEQDL